ncbi:unnamed protein product [Anisakis simplex]|uniref:TAFII55_N domain-containing protein n=1 Tax=Anisakis simplex TaxID=6269 RepID=A0A0M3K8N9_ANISI|nr:unnamed protein product [Anisakis simplex]
MPVARPVEQLSSMLVHSLDDDEFRNMLSIAAKPRYGTISNTKKFDSNAREMMNNGKNDEDDNKGKISVTTKLILHEMQRVAEEKQRKDDIG